MNTDMIYVCSKIAGLADFASLALSHMTISNLSSTGDSINNTIVTMCTRVLNVVLVFLHVLVLISSIESECVSMRLLDVRLT